MQTAEAAKTVRGGTLQALTGMRFFAALGVLLYHGTYLVRYPVGLGRIAGVGQSGVSLFFLLSGFILTFRYQSAFSVGILREELIPYLRARVARIYPMHLVALLLITPISLFFNRLPLRETLISWLATAALVQIYLPTLELQNLWNGPAWSLANEVVFYVSFPFLIAHVLPRFRSAKRLMLLAASCFLVEILMCLLLGVWQASHHSDNRLLTLAVRTPFIRIGEFLAGCALGQLFLSGCDEASSQKIGSWLATAQGRNRMLAGSLALMLILAPIRAPMSAWGQVMAVIKDHLLYAPLFAIILLALATGPTFLSPLFEHPWILLLGEASYSIYILHWIPYSLWLKETQSGKHLPGIIVPVTIVAVCIAAIGFYRWVETPARLLLRGRTQQRGTPAAKRTN